MKHSKHLLTHIQDSISYETCYQTKLNITNFHTLSCKAYVYNHLPNWNKCKLCVKEGIFVGYSDTQKSDQIYIPAK